MGVSDVLGAVKNVGMLALVLYCASVIHGVGVKWWDTMTDLDVYTVQDPNFWGPVTMLIPKNCTKFDELQDKKQVLQQPTQLSSNNSFAAKGTGYQYPTVQMSFLGHPVLPEGVSRHDVVNLVQLSKCGRNVSADDISAFQWWAAAVGTAQSSYATIDGLHSSRFRFWWFFVIAFVLSEAMGVLKSCGIDTGDAAMDMMPPEVQRQMNDAKRKQKEQEGNWCVWAYTFLLKKMSSYQSQLQICSLFVTFWDQDHYVMSYMPGMAYILMVFGIPLVMCGGMAHEALGGVCGCCLVFFVLIPVLFVYPFYLTNFLYMAFWDTGELTKYVTVVHSQWPSVTKLAGQTSSAILGFNCVDFVLEFGIACMAVVEGREPEDQHGDVFVRIGDTEAPILETSCVQPNVVHPN